MKIDNNPLSLTPAVSQSPIGGGAPKAHSGHHHGGGGGDHVQISDMAAQLATDPQRLAQLQAAVANGTYKVSPSQIANSMIDQMMQS
jgi:flagellar biosynthesis anti-sigma factor FlgM